jgi:hypothetical protein
MLSEIVDMRDAKIATQPSYHSNKDSTSISAKNFSQKYFSGLFSTYGFASILLSRCFVIYIISIHSSYITVGRREGHEI